MAAENLHVTDGVVFFKLAEVVWCLAFTGDPDLQLLVGAGGDEHAALEVDQAEVEGHFAVRVGSLEGHVVLEVQVHQFLLFAVKLNVDKVKINTLLSILSLA